MYTRRFWNVASCLVICEVLSLAGNIRELNALQESPSADEASPSTFSEVVFVVSATGDDRNPGTKAQPLATITAARDAARRLHRSRPDCSILVLIRNGVYQVESPIIFAPEDSGPKGGAVTYAAYPGEQPIISGGRRISGFQLGKNGLWQVKVPDLHGKQWRFDQLYVNGRRAVRARTPNQGYFYMTGTRRIGIDAVTGKVEKLDDHMFCAYPDDIAPLRSLPVEKLHDVVAACYQSWSFLRQHVAAVRPDKNEVFLAGTCAVPFSDSTDYCHYYFENFLEALDSPGEWFLDRDGTLYYKSRLGEDMRSVEVVAPVTDALVRFCGVNSHTVANITLRGLQFAYAQYLLPPDGQSSFQAASEVPATIMADYAENISICDCVIEHIDNYGVWFRNGCRHCLVQHCFLDDLGAGGVRLGQTGPRERAGPEGSVKGWSPKPSEVTSHIQIDNNIIRNAGCVWPDAVGILIGHSGDNHVTHNDIAGMPYTGISVGWRWGYGKVYSVQNTISYNHIHHLGWDVLADMGGIYTLGESWGSVIDNNVIHDFDSDGIASMCGIYNDNSTTGMTIENNLVYNMRNRCYQLGCGKDNVVRNNVFIGAPMLFSMYNPAEKQVAATFERNLFYGPSGGAHLVDVWGGRDCEDRLQFRYNVYWSPTKTPLVFIGKSFSEWQNLRRDSGSVVANPKFIDSAGHDYRLQPDSPALALGFKPIDYAQAGVYGDPEWIQKANKVIYAPYNHLPARTPWIITDDFEDTPVGKRPMVASSLVENKGDSIAVTDETAAHGHQCLKITDASGLKDASKPQLHYNFYSGSHSRGTTTAAFDLRINEETRMRCELGDYSAGPQRTGPCISVGDAEVRADGKSLLKVPIGKWFHVEMSVILGPQADGTWHLTVTLPGEKANQFDLTMGAQSPRVIRRLDIFSDGTDKTIYYLDNITLHNSEVDNKEHSSASVADASSL